MKILREPVAVMRVTAAFSASCRKEEGHWNVSEKTGKAFCAQPKYPEKQVLMPIRREGRPGGAIQETE